jgi:hypothetical protein
MKHTNFISIVFLSVTACSYQIDSDKVIEPLIITYPTEHNMKFTPQNPGSSDQIKLVVFDDCNYNTLAGITKKGNTIDIEKRFNSMMKWPCMMRNDTIQIGILSQGTYTVNYRLLDIATPSTPKISVAYSFNLLVSR